MRICFLADAPYVHTERWLRHFAAAGHDVHVVSFRDAKISGVTVHYVSGLEFSGKVRYVAMAGRVRSLVRRIRPDILHAMHLTSYGFLAALTGWHPLVSSVWGHDVFVVPQWTPVHLLITRFALARADIITATGDRMAGVAARYAPKGAEISVVPYGVDLDRFRPRSRDDRDITVTGYVGRLSGEKGVADLVRAAAIALAHRSSLRFEIVGDGPEEHALRNLAKSLGISDSVHFAGAVPHEAVPRVLQAFDVFALPSHAEGFGVSGVEASAMELPVVGTNVQGIPDVVEHRETGILVPPHRPDALADAILELAGQPQMRRDMGVAGRQYVSARYDWQVNVREMEHVYERALALRPSSKAR